jgi:hypothetical protein
VRWVRGVALLALTAAALVGLPASGSASPAPGPELGRLQDELRRTTEQAAALADELEAAAARDGGLRVSLARLAEQQDAARLRVDVRARQAYLAVQAAGSDPLAALVGGLAAPDLRALADAEIARRGTSAAVRAEGALADAVGAHSDATRLLQEQAAAHRASLLVQAEQATVAQEAARTLLAQAERLLAEREAHAAAERARAAREQARAAADRAAEERDRAAVAAARALLSATRTELDAASASVTRALAPAQTGRGAAAAARQAPVLELVEAAGAGYPQGYVPTGTVLRGQASWYGPGFVGSPTASGAPYDPERLTCAHKTLPLGTVVRVSRGPLAVSCLVTDRGPFVGTRILDLSRAGSRALGFDGVAHVEVEVLTPSA